MMPKKKLSSAKVDGQVYRPVLSGRNEQQLHQISEWGVNIVHVRERLGPLGMI